MEIGKSYIINEVYMMAPHISMPREGHLEAVLRVFAFICHNYNSRMEFNHTYPTIDMSDFKYCKLKYWMEN